MNDRIISGSAQCINGSDVRWRFLVTSECDVTTEELISSVIGYLAAPMWLLGHFLLLSVRRNKKCRHGQLPTWVTWSLLPHCVADVISCLGAILSTQLFPQVVFAVIVLSAHSVVAVVIVVQRIFCSTTQVTQYDLHSESIVKDGTTVPGCGCCGPALCPLILVFFMTLLSGDVTASHDANPLPITSSYGFEGDRGVGSLSVWEVCGQVLGGVACLGCWLGSIYEVLQTYRGSTRHLGRETGGVLLMTSGNAAYVITVIWRPVTPWRKSLPWTLARAGLLGMNFGMLLQLWRKVRRKKDNSVQHDPDVDTSLLSSSDGSDEGSQSDVLWDSRWRKLRVSTGPTKDNYHKFQPVTPSFPTMQCLGHGRSPQPPNRNLTYDLLQSTETSCSRTGDQDTEMEYELNRSGTEQGKQLPLLPGTSATINHHLAHLSPLTPEARHHRVVQWVVRSSPDDDDMRHITEHVNRVRDAYRPHSGSFSKTKSAYTDPQFYESRSRKNSAIF